MKIASATTQTTGIQNLTVTLPLSEYVFVTLTTVGTKIEEQRSARNITSAGVLTGYIKMALKDKQVITKISFFFEGERKVIEAATSGTFRVPVTETVNGRLKTRFKDLTAREVVAHPTIRNCDPVLTLKTGEKLRVYPAGDPSYLPAMSDGLLQKHDTVEILRRKIKEEKKKTIITPQFKDTDEYDLCDFGWDEYDYDTD
jgi:hypothetical protein